MATALKADSSLLFIGREQFHALLAAPRSTESSTCLVHRSLDVYGTASGQFQKRLFSEWTIHLAGHRTRRSIAIVPVGVDRWLTAFWSDGRIVEFDLLRQQESLIGGSEETQFSDRIVADGGKERLMAYVEAGVLHILNAETKAHRFVACGPVRDVSLAMDEQVLATVDDSSCNFRGAPEWHLAGSQHGAYIACSYDTSDGALHLLEYATLSGNLVHSIVEEQFDIVRSDVCKAKVWSPSTRVFSRNGYISACRPSAAVGGAWVVDVHGGDGCRSVEILPGGTIDDVLIGDEGRSLVTTDNAGTVALWNSESGERRWEIAPARFGALGAFGLLIRALIIVLVVVGFRRILSLLKMQSQKMGKM